MSFADSYLGRLRQAVGHELLLCPGAQIVVLRRDGSILLQRRTDNGVWEIPAGSCEPGQSFVEAAIAELQEETGICATANQLEAFASYSDPKGHHLIYPNGDEVQAFALCFLLRGDAFQVRPEDAEATHHVWHPLEAPLPLPLHPPTREVLRLLSAYLETKTFQAH